jgi:hypothetical protein
MEMKEDIRRHQRLFDSSYAGSNCEALMRQLREAFDIADWRRFVNLFRSTVSNLDAHFLLILRTRKQLFEEDDLSLDSVGCNIDSELSRSSEEIDWSLNEPDLDVPEGNNNDFDLFDRSSDGGQEYEPGDNWEGSERDSDGSEAELPVAEQEDVNEDDERSSQVGLDNEDVSDSEDGLDSEDISDNGEDLE